MDNKSIAVECFNEAWNYLDKEELTDIEKTEMLHLVHTSRYHWGLVGTIMNKARGEWQISRAYIKAGLYTAALLHGNRYLELSVEGDLSPFDMAFSYESIARAKKHLGKDFEEDYANAIKHANQIESQDDKEYTINDIKTIRG